MDGHCGKPYIYKFCGFGKLKYLEIDYDLAMNGFIRDEVVHVLPDNLRSFYLHVQPGESLGVLVDDWILLKWKRVKTLDNMAFVWQIGVVVESGELGGEVSKGGISLKDSVEGMSGGLGNALLCPFRAIG